MVSNKLLANERTKLTATYINGIAIAVMAAGVIAPLVSAFTSAPAAPKWQLGLIFACCLLVSAVLHYLARLVLEGLLQ